MKWIAVAGLGVYLIYIIYKIFWVMKNASVIAITVRAYILGQIKKILNEYSIKKQSIILKSLSLELKNILNNDETEEALIDETFKDKIEVEVGNCKNELEKLDFYNEYEKIVLAPASSIFWYAIVYGVHDFRKFIDQEYFKYISKEAEKTKDIEVTDKHLKSILDASIKEKLNG